MPNPVTLLLSAAIVLAAHAVGLADDVATQQLFGNIGIKRIPQNDSYILQIQTDPMRSEIVTAGSFIVIQCFPKKRNVSLRMNIAAAWPNYEAIQRVAMWHDNSPWEGFDLGFIPSGVGTSLLSSEEQDLALRAIYGQFSAATRAVGISIGDHLVEFPAETMPTALAAFLAVCPWTGQDARF